MTNFKIPEEAVAAFAAAEKEFLARVIPVRPAPDPDPPIMIYVAVYETQTGHIRQVVNCLNTDMHLQHEAWPGHDYIEVEVGTKPNDHAIDLQSKEVVLRTAVSAGDIAQKQKDLEDSVKVTKVTSSATGTPLVVNCEDLMLLTLAATAGGDLETDNGFVYHTEEQAKQVIKDFMDSRSVARQRFDTAKAAIETATTKADLAAIDLVQSELKGLDSGAITVKNPVNP